MNIFVLDKDPLRCAGYHCDAHVVKMILESAQMLSTACHYAGYTVKYKPTHVNHPCNIWTRASVQNWLWLKKLAKHLNHEYRFRYNKIQNHKAYDVIRGLPTPEFLPRSGLTPFALAIPPDYVIKDGDPVASYRLYYIKDKARIAKWTRVPPPRWFVDGLKETDNARLIESLSASEDEYIVDTFSRNDERNVIFTDPYKGLDKDDPDFSYF